MTQIHVAELRFHPVGVFQAFCQIPRGDLLAARGNAHLPPPVPLQFVNVDRLGGLARRRRRAPSSSRGGFRPATSWQLDSRFPHAARYPRSFPVAKARNRSGPQSLSPPAPRTDSTPGWPDSDSALEGE